MDKIGQIEVFLLKSTAVLLSVWVTQIKGMNLVPFNEFILDFDEYYQKESNENKR
jgi:hypothetical protein